MAERFLMSLAMGVFALLPLYLLSIGRDEIFFGQLATVGTIAALAVVAGTPYLARAAGLARIAPLGPVSYAAGSAIVVWTSLSGFDHAWIFFPAFALQSMGWSLHFTVGSVCLSAVSEDAERSFNFMLYAAFSTFGLSCGPLLTGALSRLLDWADGGLFAIACAAASAAAILSFAIARGTDYSHADIQRTTSIGSALGQLLRSPAGPFFVLVFLSACIYTTLIHFQATYAAANGLRHEVFFAAWALGVVGSRFAVGRKVSAASPARMLPLLCVGMSVSLAGFLAAPAATWIYATAALAIGVTYGLSYPILQAEAARLAGPENRSAALMIFSLFYFAGLYVFPYAAGVISVTHGYDALVVAIVCIPLVQIVIGVGSYRRSRAKAALELRKAP